MYNLLKKFLKKIIDKKYVSFVRNLRYIPFYLKKFQDIEVCRKRKIFIFGTPLHKNLGDHLITIAERKFIENIKVNYPIFEIPSDIYIIFKNKLKNIINVADIIVINGGGWMGNLWPEDELLMQDILKTFNKNKIIIFPQTIYYDSNKPNCEQIKILSKKSIEQVKNLTLCVRDRNSYNFAKEEFIYTDILLLPDIALSYYEGFPSNILEKKRNIVGICLRNDREVESDIGVIDKIKYILVEYGLTLNYTDTINKSRIFELEREKYCYEKINEFSKYKLIITDRLHGMIYAYLAGTPCIIFDNKTKKVFGVYNEWLKNANNILTVTKTTDFEIVNKFIFAAINEKLNRNNSVTSNKFYELEEIIKNA